MPNHKNQANHRINSNTMRTIIKGILITLLATACTNIDQPSNPNSGPSQPEATGSQANPEQQGTAFSISTEVFYQASVQSPSSPGKVISLSLQPKGGAEMSTDRLDTSAVTVERGQWTTLSNGNLLLNLQPVGGTDSILREFKTDGDKLVYTGSEYGTAGLTLWVKHIPK